MYQLVLTLFVASLLGASESLALDSRSSLISGRIIAGETVDINAAPYLVSLRYKKNSSTPFEHRCSAMIYSKDVVLTTATCVVGVEPRNLHVVAGTSHRTLSDGYVYPVDSYTVHPDFNIWFTDNDLAVLQLGLQLPTMKSIVTIPLATTLPNAGRPATIAGWGSTSEDRTDGNSELLQMATVRIVSEADCKQSYGQARITAAMLCAAGTSVNETSGSVADACTGDAGSPLVINEAYAVGLASWGSGCGRPNRPGVYTNLLHFKAWIEQQATTTTL